MTTARGHSAAGPISDSTKLPVLVRLPISHYCRKVEWALAYAGIRYAARDVWFRELLSLHDLNPEGTVPVLVADGQRLCGSHAIMEWIHRQRPQAGLYPDARAKEVRAWEAWADEELGPLVRRDAYRTIFEHPTRYTRNPAAWLALRVARPQVLAVLKHIKARRDYPRDDAVRDEVLSRVGKRLREHGTGFLFGPGPTAADFATAALLAPLLPLRRHPVARHPERKRLGSYVRRVRPNRWRRWRQRRTRLLPDERARWASLPAA